jgi:siderophore synthetase component
MAKPTNGNERSDDAVKMLAQAQAALVQANASLTQANANLIQSIAQTNATYASRHAEIEAQLAKIEAERREIERANGDRFARIEALLMEHNRMILALTEAVRDRIGFKAPDALK